jgi:hypothetical protein
MKPVIRKIHVLWLAAVFEGRQHAPKLGDELRVEAAWIVSHEEPLQLLMSKLLDHM